MTKLYLIRGLPGSGKSTLAKELAPYHHYEADQYFLQGDGYAFDATKLPRAHKWCQDWAAARLAQGHTVAVSNTFTTIKELRPYFEIARDNGIVPAVIHCQGNWGSIHGVPEATIAKMKARWAYDLTELYNEYACS